MPEPVLSTIVAGLLTCTFSASVTGFFIVSRILENRLMVILLMVLLLAL